MSARQRSWPLYTAVAMTMHTATGADRNTFDQSAELYLDLLKKSLTHAGATTERRAVTATGTGLRQGAKRRLLRELEKRGLAVYRDQPVDPVARAEGRDWPERAETMVGLRRLENLQSCVADVVALQVPGDIVETGVWRGGAMIFARAVLKVLGDTTRVVWCAASFEGLPPPDADAYPADEGDRHSTAKELAVSLEDVRANFARYDLLDD